MTDRREVWSKASAEEIAQICAQYNLRRFPAEAHRMPQPVTDLCAAPAGVRDRQLLRGQAFTVHVLSDTGWAFGETDADGYSGWVEAAQLVGHPESTPTHRISSAKSYGKTTDGLKTQGRITPLSMGSEVIVLDTQDGWSRIAWTRGLVAKDLYVPSVHLTPIDVMETDPVSVAERLLGTPYLWGGNTSFGIDCSGLVQIACRACGIPCPGDSDQQAAILGDTLPPNTPPQRGDILFWKGHVGWVYDLETLLHANAHAMAVTYEPLKAAITRINAQGDGPVTRHARLTAL